MLIACLVALGLGCILPLDGPTDEELARAYAPIIFQRIDPEDPLTDLIVSIDFDGDEDPLNNWENTWTGNHDPVLYHSVVETSTHWYIIYGIYHAQDYSHLRNVPDFEHEHDLEGFMLVVERDGTRLGTPVGAITVLHRELAPYAIGKTEVKGHGVGSGPRMLVDEFGPTRRPMLMIESGGHGVSAYHPLVEVGPAERETIRYDLEREFTDSRIAKTSVPWNTSYTLESLDPFWDFQLYEWTTGLPSRGEFRMYDGWGRMDGDRSGTCGERWNLFCTPDSARMPWAWTAHNSTQPAGMMAVDPARLFTHLFYDTGEIDRVYLQNRYLEAVPECPRQPGRPSPLESTPFVDLEVDLICP